FPPVCRDRIPVAVLSANVAQVRIAFALLLGATILAGCNSQQYSASPYGAAAPVTLSPQQQTAMAQQTQQYQQRAASLDHDNQELQSMLAQSEQQSQILEEQVPA